MGKNTETLNTNERAFITAACRGNIEEVEALLQKNTNVDARDSEQRTALFYAAQRGFADIAKLLLHHGANKDCKDMFGLTPLVFMNEMPDNIMTGNNVPFASAIGKEKIRKLLAEEKIELY